MHFIQMHSIFRASPLSKYATMHFFTRFSWGRGNFLINQQAVLMHQKLEISKRWAACRSGCSEDGIHTPNLECSVKRLSPRLCSPQKYTMLRRFEMRANSQHRLYGLAITADTSDREGGVEGLRCRNGAHFTRYLHFAPNYTW